VRWVSLQTRPEEKINPDAFFPFFFLLFIHNVFQKEVVSCFFVCGWCEGCMNYARFIVCVCVLNAVACVLWCGVVEKMLFCFAFSCFF